MSKNNTQRYDLFLWCWLFFFDGMASVLKDVLFVSCDFFPLWFVVLLIDVFYCDTNTGNAILRELPGEGRFMRNNSKNSSSNTIGYTIGVQVTATTAAATTATAATAAKFSEIKPI